MKPIEQIFSTLIIVFLLFSAASFIAGSMIFLNIQFYNQIYQLGGWVVAFFVILLEILVFYYVSAKLLGSMFSSIFDKKKKESSDEKKINNKILVAALVYEVLKLLYIKSRK